MSTEKGYPSQSKSAPYITRSSDFFRMAVGSSSESHGLISGHLSTLMRNASASTLGASIVALLVTPLDVVKVRMQAHVCPIAGETACEDPKHVTSSFDAARKIVRTHGIRGLWRGLNVTLVLAVPTTGLYFTMYEAIRARTRDNISPTVSAILSGSSARCISAFAASPLELARTSLQAGVGGPHATVLSVLGYLYRKDGLLALWRGIGPTLVRDAPFSSLYWASYEFLKDPNRSILPKSLFTQGKMNFSVYLASGIGAGGLAAFCTVPADVIKTRRQALLSKRSGPSSIKGIATEIIEKEGVRGLYRGAFPRVAKVGSSCAIMMSSYELFRKWFGG